MDSKQSETFGKVTDFNLFNTALVSPRISAPMPSTLKIVSGYATHAMAVSHYLAMKDLAHRLKSSLPLNIELIYGMAGSDGVSKVNHRGFISLEEHKEFEFDGSFSCAYVKKPKSVHSKVYVWCNGDVPVRAYVGSANYSETAFKIPNRTETLAECDPTSALDFYNSIKPQTIECAKADRDKDFVPPPRTLPTDKKRGGVISVESDINSPYFGCEKLTLSLLTRNGDLGNGSCLNWGVKSDGNPRTSGSSVRDPNQSYIGIPVAVQRSGFFPNIQHRFTIMTDDGKILTCVRAQANGKGIETPQDNAELGRYFRQRLGLASGAYIKVSDMRNYGRFDVVFYKQDEENYVMDFSRP